MTNGDSLIYVLVSLVFQMFIFGILAHWICDFWSFVNGSY